MQHMSANSFHVLGLSITAHKLRVPPCRPSPRRTTNSAHTGTPVQAKPLRHVSPALYFVTHGSHAAASPLPHVAPQGHARDTHSSSQGAQPEQQAFPAHSSALLLWSPCDFPVPTDKGARPIPHLEDDLHLGQKPLASANALQLSPVPRLATWPAGSAPQP